MAALHGFEPRLTESESAVLPLDDSAMVFAGFCIYQFILKCNPNFEFFLIKNEPFVS